MPRYTGTTEPRYDGSHIGGGGGGDTGIELFQGQLGVGVGVWLSERVKGRREGWSAGGEWGDQGETPAFSKVCVDLQDKIWKRLA